MRKIYGCLFLALFSKSLVFSQVNTQINQLESPSTQEECRANQLHERLMQTDPAYVQRRTQIEAQYEAVLRSGAVNKTTYTIPVVVHVIHTGQAVGVGANISDAQIQSAIDNLNDAYSNTSTAHTTYTGANTNIQFCLAQRDPSGNPTTGIVRVDGSGVTQYSSKGICDAGGGTGTDNEVAVKALSKWDNTKYYNFWIVTEINDNNAGAGTQGYAYFPGAGASLDGAVMMYNSFGYDPDASLGYNLKNYTNRNVTAVHEVGHALNLYHTFQGDGTGSTCPTDAVCGTSGDCVGDTPRHKRSTSSCVSDATANACQGGTTAGDYQHNFMDYSSDDCQTEFTAGQITRMNAVMTGTRSSLASSDGCNPVYTRDVGVQQILTPNSTTCGTSFTPEVRVKNYGSGTITSFTVNYDLDGGTNQTYNWTGTLTSGSTVDIPLSVMNTTAGSHTFNASTTVPNGLADEYASNDDEDYTFTIIGTPPTAAICSPTTTDMGNFGTGIDRVQFNTIDNAHTDDDNDGLHDFTCTINTTVSTNTGYNLTVTTQDNEYVIAYIDYDDDGNFEAGELVLDHRNSNAGTSHSVTVNIPQYPEVTGKLIRMRIKSNYNSMSSDICVDSDYGEFEDYSIYITTPPCVAPTLNSSPSDLVGCDPVTGTFTCSVTGPSLTYQWQVDTGTGFNNVSNGGIYSGATSNTLTITAANNSYSGYMYRCYISNPCGNVTSNAATLRSYVSPTNACSVTTSNTGNFGTGIIRFQFNGIDRVHNDNINDGTQNFTCTDKTSVTAGSSYAFTITGAGTNPEYARIYIDFNDDGDFADAGESVFTNTTTRQASHTGNIAIPSSGYVAGKILRMRVMTDYATFASGCPGSLVYGEVEDYGITIVTPPTITTSAGASRCTAGTLSLSASASTGFVKWYDASTGGNLVGAGTSFTTPSLATTTTYYAEAIDGALISASRTAVIAAVIPNTQIRSYDCGRTSMDFTEKIYCDPVSGANGYRFEVFDGTNTYEIDRTVRYFYLTQIPGNAYNKTYTIRVKAQTGGYYGCYGSSCNVMTARPRTKVGVAQCGVMLAAIDTRIFAETRPDATGYRFKVLRNGANVQIVDKTENVFRLTDLPSYNYNTTYTVYVAYEADGMWGLYGAGCDVTTPAAPATQVQASQCGTTLATTTAADKIYANNVYLATDYRFEVTYGGNTQVIDRTARYFYITQYSGWQHNRTYSIRVAAKVNGSWTSYGAACNVTTPASGMMQDDNVYEMTEDLMGDLSLEAYPNPNSGNFVVSSSHEGTFNVINELGQLMQRVQITKEGGFEARVEGLENGVYFVTGTINGEVITKKVMVLK